MEYNGIKLRHEKKFFISDENRQIIKARLENVIDADENGDEHNTYTVTSLYLDDMYDNSYFSKLSGVRDRLKYRIRFYKNDPSSLTLEKKVKYGEYIGKVGCPLTRQQYEAIFTGDRAEILLEAENELLREVFVKIRTARLAPKIVVEYDREAYVSEHGNVRITFDKNLRAGIHNMDVSKKNYDLVSAQHDGKMIMEVKYDSYLPSVVRNLLSETGREFLSISKYIMCTNIDTLYGGNSYNGKHTIIPRHI